ncbi:MAG: hypothetical protein H6558_20310 [Lewinellaceae bacterium]|nr:hypothetical protein [Lewinellaceae bacterium]MCB9289179.1 hypothetical protein [Lewinellaceae bacterium]
MRTLPVLSIVLLACFTAKAQVYWQGGFPGRETEWTEPRNWSTGQVPGWKDFAVIPYQDHGFYPEVSSVVPLIQALAVRKEATLTIAPEGVLTIDGEGKEDEAIRLQGFLFNFGALILTEMELGPVESQLAHLDNQGVCSLVTDMGHIPLLSGENQ